MTTLDFYEAEEENLGVLQLITANEIEVDDQGKIITKESKYHDVFTIWKEKRLKRVLEKEG